MAGAASSAAAISARLCATDAQLALADRASWPDGDPARWRDFSSVEATKETITVVGRVLTKLAIVGDQESVRRTSLFHLKRPPPITFSDYVSRCHRHLRCSRSSYILAVVYVDRIIKSTETGFVDSCSIHSLFLACLRLASKFIDDDFDSNVRFALVGGLSQTLMLHLEAALLHMLGFELTVPARTFSTYCSALHASSAADVSGAAHVAAE